MYSSIHNQDLELKVDVYLDGECFMEEVAMHHVESVVFDLEMQGFDIVEEQWCEGKVMLTTGCQD